MSKYSPYLSRLETASNTLAGLAGFVPIPSVSLSIPSSQLYPGSTVFSKMGKADSTASFVAQDRPFLKRFAVFCNFADGLVLDTTIPADPIEGKFSFSLLLRSSAAADEPPPAPNVTSGQRLFFQTLNAWNEVDSFVPFFGVDEFGGLKRMYSALELFRFRTDSIDTAYNGENATFVIAFEVEHTFPMIAL